MVFDRLMVSPILVTPQGIARQYVGGTKSWWNAYQCGKTKDQQHRQGEYEPGEFTGHVLKLYAAHIYRLR